MNAISPDKSREFAVEVVRCLRAAGFETVWAGGCVRDQLLGQVPKDYDVATSATPEEIRRIFGQRRTLVIGASFGVITVLGPAGAEQIDIATFRQDAEYSDGRHPDGVTFSNARDDAQRRDFTINGLFYDPIEQRVIDYVDGEQDIKRKIVRAIGDPEHRIQEDKLRMLRAIRFATTFQFDLDIDTEMAIRQFADELVVVSAERIAAEMRQILVHPERSRGVQLLVRLNLLEVVIPEVGQWCDGVGEEKETWLRVLGALSDPTFSVSLAALLWPVVRGDMGLVEQVCRCWKLSNEETRRIVWMIAYEGTLRRARQTDWPCLQRILIDPAIDELLQLATAIEYQTTGKTQETEFCRDRLQLDPAELNPLPLITGDDLILHGLSAGKEFRVLLDAVRDAQLNKQIVNRREALELVNRLRGRST